MRIFRGLRTVVVAALMSALAAGAHGATSPFGATLRGAVVDASGLPLPGVELALTRRAWPPFVFLTDLDGKYSVSLPPGRYELRAVLAGFEPFFTTIDLADGPPLVRDIVLAPAGVQEQVHVAAQAPEVLGTTAADPAALGRTVIDNATVPHNRFDDVLPLLPGVVRGPDGLISVAGARAPQGTLLVNGVGEIDPVTGEFASTLPLAAVDKLEVSTTSTSAEHGNAVGGVTQVTTRSGDDSWHFSVNSLDPRPHIVHGWIRGIDAWEPNGGIRGPIVRGRAWVAQSFDYRYERTWFDTVVGRQPTRVNGLASLTQVDTQIKAGHLVSTLFSLYPETIHHAALNAFTPASATPDLHTGGWSATIIDRLALGDRAALESRAQVKRLDLSLTPETTEPYIVGHDLVHGGYFNTRTRTAWRAAWAESYTRTIDRGGRNHEVEGGGSVTYLAMSGRSTSRTAELLRSDGTLARTVDFEGAGDLSASAYEVALFAQDRVALMPALRLDVGLRFDKTTIADSARLSPRIGWSYAFPDGSTTLSGNAGVYADKLVLGAAAFPMQQDRIVTAFDGTGDQPSSRVVYDNVVQRALRIPVASAWTLQLDRRFGRGWIARFRYQERHGRDELAVQPVLRSAAAGDMVLDSNGQSRSKSAEITVGRRTATAETYVSYVRSATRGNLNDLNSVEGNFRQLLVQPDAIAPLAVDVPNRLLAWAVVRLPWRVTFAPFFELRNGFPYSAIDDEWNETAPRHNRRFPPFASLDLVGSKIVKLPFGLPNARVGLKLFNVTGRFNGRDIQRDVQRPDFATTYNPGRRTLRGIFEVIWSPGSDDDRRR